MTDVFVVTALAAAIAAFGFGYFVGLIEGRGEADRIAAKVVERMARR